MPDEQPSLAAENVTTLRTDAVRAQEFRDAAKPLLEKLAVIMDKAKSEGLSMSFSVNPDSFGRYRPSEITIVKPL